MQIRPEKKAEFPALYELVKVAFQTAKVSSGDEQNFVDRLRAGGNYIPELALVAEDEGKLIGQIMLTKTFVVTTNGSFPLLLLAPIAVILERRKQGIAAKLIEESLRRAKAQGHKALILVGDPAFYARFYFKPSAEFGITNANEIPDEYVLACELIPGALLDAAGVISFEV